MANTTITTVQQKKFVAVHEPALADQLRKIGVEEGVIRNMSVTQAKSRIYRHERTNQMMMEHRPYLLPTLVKLGVLLEHAKTFTVLRAYEVIDRLIRQRAGPYEPGMATDTQLYWLFTHGVMADNAYTEDQAKQLLEMIWSSEEHKKKGEPGGAHH